MFGIHLCIVHCESREFYILIIETTLILNIVSFIRRIYYYVVYFISFI